MDRTLRSTLSIGTVCRYAKGELMLNTLYAALIAACLYLGYMQFALWVVIPLGAAAVFLFFLSNRAAFEVGMRERGAIYFLIILAGNIILCGAVFAIGWVASTFLS